MQNSNWRLPAVVALTVIGAVAAAPAEALPSVPQAVLQAGSEASPMVVQHRYAHRWRGHGHGHRWHRHGGRGHGIGPFLGGLAAGAIIGGALDHGHRGHHDHHDHDGHGHDGWSRDAVARCEARFRSFDRSTGTYTTYSGETRTCPYLR